MIFINTATNSTGLFKPFFPISIPYGLGYLMGELRSEGIHFSFIDQQIVSNVFKDMDSLLINHTKPYVFAISTLTEALSQANKISSKLKKLYPESVVIFGGIHPSALPEEVLKNNPNCDYVFLGEAETEIVNIYNKLKSGNDLKDQKGIAYRQEDEIVINQSAEILKNINTLSKFPYDLFIPYKKYNLAHIISSRGCPHNCSFCCVKVVGRRNYRFKSAAETVKELECLATECGQKHISFFDDNFLANNKRIEDLCNEISKSEKLKSVTYSFQARTRDMNEEILKLMYNTGFNAVFFGIETVSEKLLKQIGKDESIEEISEAIKMAQKIGFKVMANFLFCLPNETRIDRTACVNFALEHNIDLVKFNNVVPYPGTQMYEDLLSQNKLNIMPDYSNFNSQEVLVRSVFKKRNFPYVPDNSVAYGVEKEIMFAYFRYYFRFKMISKILKQKNWGDAIFHSGDSFISKLKKTPAFILLLIDISFKFVMMFFSVFRKNGIKFKDILNCFVKFFN
ncbi:MAG TPA: radical SAM protein [Bacteroidales bacterium]|mgnify:CR=1 FL=1|nr:radical SAM protein [Bacteroidales bacterium]